MTLAEGGMPLRVEVPVLECERVVEAGLLRVSDQESICEGVPVHEFVRVSLAVPVTLPDADDVTLILPLCVNEGVPVLDGVSDVDAVPL